MSIFDKLNLKKYNQLIVINQPSDYTLFHGQATALSANHDAIFIFIETIEEMIRHTRHIASNSLLQEQGYLFFAYPKKGNKRYSTYIHRDEIHPAMNIDEDGYVEGTDLKFARMVSMDDTFTVVGLKREKKKSKKSAAPSQSVADYEDYVKEVEALLNEHPQELAFYRSLTPGYRKDWARYIFSAKQPATRDKRRLEMIDILAQKYKSIALYRQQKQ
ncbi:YdeI/OmpD-associated family protein [Paenibacillus senegalensis]|uniref:YdeI/OmpD-associated family protein n=1 Tax=Paenibacillus senegalensis TaxID=1465766 RepID=UPI000288CE53|nr:YdeI/OmpD-associated family protein [Paenibacillus senegalensis]